MNVSHQIFKVSWKDFSTIYKFLMTHLLVTISDWRFKSFGVIVIAYFSDFKNEIDSLDYFKKGWFRGNFGLDSRNFDFSD